MSVIRAIDKKLLIMGGFIIGVIIVFLMLSFFTKMSKSGYISYYELEDKIIKASQEYIETNVTLLPNNNYETSTLDISEIVVSGHLNELSNYVKDGNSCIGEVNITKYDDNYIYVPKLDCSSYKTEFLIDKLMSNVVENGNGLYNMDNEYYYRGETKDNYIKIDDTLYRIVSIDSKGNIKIVIDLMETMKVWDDRYNTEEENNNGKNNYSMSRIRDYLNDLENKYDVLKSMSIKQTQCIDLMSASDTTKYNENYCNNTYSEDYFGLLNVYEFARVSLDEKCIYFTDAVCNNYNYLGGEKSWWTITGDSDSTSGVFRYHLGKISSSIASTNNRVRFTALLHAKVRYLDGIGTKENPYVIN